MRQMRLGTESDCNTAAELSIPSDTNLSIEMLLQILVGVFGFDSLSDEDIT